jgi:CRP/FNR family cyclic AMP-dependent transcriptional regulator
VTQAAPGPAGHATPTAAAAALVTAVAASRPAEQQLREAGLEVLGACTALSARPGLMALSPLLQDFTPAEADLLGEAMLRVRAHPGQRLIAEGEPSDWMLLVLAGTVDVGKRRGAPGPDGAVIDDDGPSGNAGDGGISRVGVVREGALLGEMSMLDGQPRFASCWALTEVEAGVIDRPAVARLITDHPGVGAKLLVKVTQLLAQRLRNTSHHLIRVLHPPAN